MARYSMAVSLSFSVFLLMFGTGVIVPLLPGRIIGLSGSFADVGCLASAFALPFVLLQFPMGKLADRYGLRTFLLAGYLFCCFSGLIYGFADSRAAIFVGRSLQGIGEAPLWALAPALLSIHYSECKGLAIGMYNASIHLGLTAGSLVALFTLDVWVGNEAFWLFSATSLCGGLLVAILKGRRDRGASDIKGRSAERNIASLVSDVKTSTVLAGIILYGCGYGMLVTVIPVSMIGSEPAGGISVGLFFVLFYVAMSISQLVGGHLSDRAGTIKSMIFGLIAAAAGLVLAPGLHSVGLQISLGLASFGLGVFYVSSMTFFSECTPFSQRGAISGAFCLSWGGGYFVGPILLGKLVDFGSLKPGMLIFAMLLFTEAIAVAFVHRRSLSPARL